MGVSMAAFTTFIEQFSDILWNSLLLFLLVGTGVYFTVRLRGVQVRRFGEGFRRVFGGFTLRGKKADAEGMSSFQALTTAIAAQVGTGNITGCATALVSGGPGALFWTWVSAFFGMATIYAEAVLAQHYKTTVNGHVTGGPAYYIRAAFKGKVGKVLATVFSVLIILALGFMGNMVQSNSIGDAFHNAFGLNRLAVGVVVAAIAAFIFLGGVQRIAAVTEKVVPIMAAFYILGCIVILVINAKALPGALAQVFVLAFEPQAMAGGIAGVTVQQSMRFGVARGLFSNEAGLGSTPHAHALAKVERPQDQGAVAILGVFVDTFVVLTLTGLVLITSGLIPQGMTGTVADPGRLQPGVRRLWADLHRGVHVLFRVFDDHRLVFLRPVELQGAVRREAAAGVQHYCSCVHSGRLDPEGRSGLGAGRPVQRPDGRAEPAGPAGAGRRGCGD